MADAYMYEGVHGGEIFQEYFEEVKKKKYSIKEIANFVMSLYNEPTDDNDKKKLASLKKKTDIGKIMFWNKDMASNGETHGTIFAMLEYGGHKKLLARLERTIDDFDT